MTDTMRLVQIALNNDPSLTAKTFQILDAANDADFDWQAEQARDPGYEQWIEEQAMTEGYRHARMPGE